MSVGGRIPINNCCWEKQFIGSLHVYHSTNFCRWSGENRITLKQKILQQPICLISKGCDLLELIELLTFQIFWWWRRTGFGRDRFSWDSTNQKRERHSFLCVMYKFKLSSVPVLGALPKCYFVLQSQYTNTIIFLGLMNQLKSFASWPLSVPPLSMYMCACVHM